MTAAIELQPDPIPQRPVLRKTWRPARQIAVDLGTANTLILVKGEGVVLD